MRLRERRQKAKRVFAPLRVFRVGWERLPRARWRWSVRGRLSGPSEPYELSFTSYPTLVISEPARHPLEGSRAGGKHVWIHNTSDHPVTVTEVPARVRLA